MLCVDAQKKWAYKIIVYFVLLSVYLNGKKKSLKTKSLYSGNICVEQSGLKVMKIRFPGLRRPVSTNWLTLAISSSPLPSPSPCFPIFCCKESFHCSSLTLGPIRFLEVLKELNFEVNQLKCSTFQVGSQCQMASASGCEGLWNFLGETAQLLSACPFLLRTRQVV